MIFPMKINSTVFEKFPILQTKRLVLREIKEIDAEEIFKMRADGRVNGFIARPQMLKLETAQELVEKTQNAFANKKGIGWAGVVKNTSAIIGSCGFNSIDFDNLRAEIGGELSVQFWGKRIAIEAVTEIVNFGFSHLNFHTINAKVFPNNRGAIFLLELLGFTKEAHLKNLIYFNGKFIDMAIYSITNPNH